MINDAVLKATKIPTLTSMPERLLLSDLAKAVKPGGLIVEIGALYGGITAILGLSNPQAEIITIDNFSWHPEGYPVTSKAMVLENMQSVGVNNVTVIDGTSQETFLSWERDIDLLWIDGGHSFKYVYFDLYNYGRRSQVIALHDYGNPAWKDIERAINIFLSKEHRWRFDRSVDMVAVLRRK